MNLNKNLTLVSYKRSSPSSPVIRVIPTEATTPTQRLDAILSHKATFPTEEGWLTTVHIDHPTHLDPVQPLLLGWDAEADD